MLLPNVFKLLRLEENRAFGELRDLALRSKQRVL